MPRCTRRNVLNRARRGFRPQRVRFDRILDLEPEFLEGDGQDHDHDHHHDHEARSRSDHATSNDSHGGLKHYQTRRCNRFAQKRQALDADKFFPWVQDLVQKEGPSILRCKGISPSRRRPALRVPGVHMILDGDHQRPWNMDEKRQSASSSSAQSAGQEDPKG